LRSMLQLGHPTAHVFRDHTRKSGHGPASYGPTSHGQGGTDRDGQSLQAGTQLWIPPIIRTVATEGQGIPELAAAIAGHRQHLAASGELAQRELARLRAELDLLLREALVARWQDRMPDERYAEMLERVARREVSPWQAADELTQEY